MSKWLAATSLTGWGSSQAYVYVAGAILGPAGLGGLKAAQTLVAGPAGVLIQAGGSIGLPEASKAHAEKRLGRSRQSVAGGDRAGVMSFAAGALVVMLWGRSLLSRIYGPQFAHLQTVAVLIAIAYIFTGLSVGPVLVLKQTRNAHRIFYTQIATLAVSLTTVAVLSIRYGVTGAAMATIATYVVAAAGVWWYQHVVRGTVAQPAGRDDDPARCRAEPPCGPLRAGRAAPIANLAEGRPTPPAVEPALTDPAAGGSPAAGPSRLHRKRRSRSRRGRRGRARGAGIAALARSLASEGSVWSLPTPPPADRWRHFSAPTSPLAP